MVKKKKTAPEENKGVKDQDQDQGDDGELVHTKKKKKLTQEKSVYMAKVEVDPSSSSGSSSSEDDEEINKIRQAIEPNLFNINPSPGKSTGKNLGSINGKKIESGIASSDSAAATGGDVVSNRTDINQDEKWNSGHFQSVTISEDSQRFIAKKLFKSLNKQIEEVQPQQLDNVSSNSKSSQSESSSGIYLFSNSTSKISATDVDNFTNTSSESTTVNRKRKFHKRKEKKLADELESDDELTKLKSVAVSSEWVLGLGCS